jgi:hypothetical protein
MGAANKGSAHSGLVDASRASLSLLLVLPVEPRRRWCLPLVAEGVVVDEVPADIGEEVGRVVDVV